MPASIIGLGMQPAAAGLELSSVIGGPKELLATLSVAMES